MKHVLLFLHLFFTYDRGSALPRETGGVVVCARRVFLRGEILYDN